MAKEEYNEIPVFYCKDCLSLTILNIDKYNYCRRCGSTDIGVSLIDDWEKMYEDKFGTRHLNKKN